MAKLIIIHTEGNRVENLLAENGINNYEVYQNAPSANINEEEAWRQAVREASQDKERQKEIKAWDKVSSKVKV